MATHRYQDGHFLATCRFDPRTGRAEPVPAAEDAELRTVFMVLNQGRVAFEGSLAELNASGDPYVAKFVRHVE